ncbi:MAG: beta-propeller fold lactonase family protein [Gemmatimonadota bacterium]
MMGGVDAPIGCASCHVYMNPGALVRSVIEDDYLSPHDLAIAPDGGRLYVVAEDADAVLVVDLADRTVVDRIQVGRRPHGIVLSPDGRTAYVSNSWSDDVSVVDLAGSLVTGTLPTGMAPADLALDPDGRTLFVANRGSDDISVIDLAEGRVVKRLAAGNNPYAVSVTDAGRLLVTSRLTEGTHFRDPPRTEITVVDVEQGRVIERHFVESAHLLEGVDALPGGDLALATMVRPNNLVPASQVGQGWMLTYGLVAVRPGTGQPPVQLLLDDVNGYFADPYDVVVTPDGTRAFVTHAATDVVTAIDVPALRAVLDAAAAPDSAALFANHLGLSQRYVLARIPTASNPKRMAVAPDGRHVYVAERLADRVAVIDVETLTVVDTIGLGGPDGVSTLRLGARQFHGARAFQGQFSCRTCHPDLDQDALAWDFAGSGMGQNIVNTMTLRDIGRTSPFKWAGTNTSLYMQDGIRFAKHLTRVDPFPTEELRAVVAYIYAIEAPPNRYRSAELTEAQRRGRALFERTRMIDGTPIPPEGRCITCHDGPYYTNREKFDVGTRRDTDKPGMLFDTPQLINLADTDPYLHDGSAPTLETIWTENSENDEHGVVSDLGKTELNDLIEYLRMLGPPQPRENRP